MFPAPPSSSPPGGPMAGPAGGGDKEQVKAQLIRTVAAMKRIAAEKGIDWNEVENGAGSAPSGPAPTGPASGGPVGPTGPPTG